MAEELQIPLAHMAALSGPNHAEEIARGSIALGVVAAEQEQVAVFFQELLMAPFFRLYTSPDLIGVELGGALKNVIAIAAGISDGLGYGDNTKAALITRGLTEISRLGVALGAEASTFAGLSGLGDLMVTCTSKLSRNRGAGEQLGRGKTFAQIEASSAAVIEGARTAMAVKELSRKLSIEMPISDSVYDIIYEDHPVREAMYRLMQRMAKPEDEVLARSRWR